jgi:arylsulfatase
VPKIFNLRTDPYERADQTSNTYFDWMIDRAWLVIPAQALVAQMMQSLVEFPPSQKSASFTIGQLMKKLEAGLPS